RLRPPGGGGSALPGAWARRAARRRRLGYAGCDSGQYQRHDYYDCRARGRFHASGYVTEKPIAYVLRQCPPGSAGLQPGSRSHAGAWRSQGQPWRTGSGCMKQPSSAPPNWLGQLRYAAPPLNWRGGSPRIGDLMRKTLREPALVLTLVVV